MPIFNINSDVQTVKFTEYAPALSLGPLWASLEKNPRDMTQQELSLTFIDNNFRLTRKSSLKPKGTKRTR